MTLYKPVPNAPRLRAFLQKQSGKRLLLMDKRVWKELTQHQTGEFEVEINQFPMAEVSRLTRVGSIAKRVDKDIYEIKIYREDLEDTKPINVDYFLLHDDFYSRQDFGDWVKRASTSDDENMKAFLDKFVLIEIKEPGGDHHLEYSDLPEFIKYRFID